MADEEDQEVTEEEENPLLLKPTAESFSDDFKDEEKLVVTVITSSRCPHCQGLLPFLNKLSKQEEYSKAKFMWVDADAVPDAAQQLNICSVPHTAYSLKGEVLEQFSGSNTEKFEALLKNTVNKRNEEMKEYDAAKKAEADAAAAAAAAAAGAAEGGDEE
eukprot:TRINITY_DN8696_c2_g1_i1.p1 TRINITY_DN8696_c2_g1~~TRINITY_DN8696_c2_g1_i1.p1  ORF type:complete len:160 (+),score=78.38 TRINITY_DN8696_c2_g1_i1:58-537(+)